MKPQNKAMDSHSEGPDCNIQPELNLIFLFIDIIMNAETGT